MKINLREQLNNIDKQTCNKYDLLNMYECCNLSDKEKEQLASLCAKTNNAKTIYEGVLGMGGPKLGFGLFEDSGTPEGLEKSVIKIIDNDAYEFYYWDDMLVAENKTSNNPWGKHSTEYDWSKSADENISEFVKYIKEWRKEHSTNESLNEERAYNLSDRQVNIAEYIYNNLDISNRGSRQEVSIDTDIDDVREYWDDEATETDFEIAKSFIEDIINYGLKYYEGDIELSDKHILWDINADIDNEDYWALADEATEKFNAENGVEASFNGRSGRHVVIEDTFDNFMRFKELKDNMEKAQQEFIDKVNNEYGNKLSEDTVKTKSGKWVNKGKEGTHGTFKTKKEADAQRKAMFARGFKESVAESDTVEDIDDYAVYRIDTKSHWANSPFFWDVHDYAEELGKIGRAHV